MVPKIIRPDGAHSISLSDVMFRYGIGSEESDGGREREARLDLVRRSGPPR
jgi:hypothetical protein